MTVSPHATLIWQRFTNVSCLRTYYGEKAGLVSSQTCNSVGEDSICMVNLLVTLRVIVFLYYFIDLLRLFQNRRFVLSSEHEIQNVATIGTLLDRFMLSCK